MGDPDLTGVALLFLFVIFLPFLVSLFGSRPFIFITFVCCCLSSSWFFALPTLLQSGLLPWLLLVSWAAAWYSAVVGIRTRRAYRRRRIVGRLYLAAFRERFRQPPRGKNRALSWPD